MSNGYGLEARGDVGSNGQYELNASFRGATDHLIAVTIELRHVKVGV
jgi:hypothetical protein